MPNKGPTRRAARGRDKLLFKCTELDVTRRYRVLPRVHPLATIHDERTVDCTIKVYNTNIYMYGCVYVCVHKAGMKGVTRLMFHFVNRSRPSTQNARHRRFSRLFQRPRASLKRDDRSEASSELRATRCQYFLVRYIESCATSELYIKYLVRKINI